MPTDALLLPHTEMGVSLRSYFSETAPRALRKAFWALKAEKRSIKRIYINFKDGRMWLQLQVFYNKAPRRR